MIDLRDFEGNLGRFLPHSGEMVLIDKVLEISADCIVTQTNLANHALFCESNGGFVAFKGIELMAQSLGILRGVAEVSSRKKLGFLLGARNFKMFAPFIFDCAITKAKISMQGENGLGVYDCEIFEGDFSRLVATASISTLNPSDEFLAQIKGNL